MIVTCTKSEVKAIRNFLAQLPDMSREEAFSRIKVSVKGANPFQKLAYVMNLKDEFKMEVAVEIEEEYFLAQMDLMEDMLGMVIIPMFSSFKRLQAKALAMEEKFGMKPDDIESEITDYDEEDRKHAEEARAKLQEVAEKHASQRIDIPDDADGKISNH